jgi:hypothetical protein
MTIEMKSNFDWDKWLEEKETFYKESGYRKYNQNLKGEDFAYWKVFKDEEEEVYQIGILVFDFRKYPQLDPQAERIGLQYECMLINVDYRIDLIVCKDMFLTEFEIMAKDFYEIMKIYK